MIIGWSPQAAYDAGARIGRQLVDPSIDERALKQVVLGRLGPSFRPRKTVAEARAEAYSGVTGTVVFLCVVLTSVVVAVLEPTWVPQVLPELRQSIAEAIPASVLVFAIVIVLGIAIVVVVLAVRATRRAKASRQRAWRKLAEEAYRGAAEAVNRRRGLVGVPVAPVVHPAYAELHPAPEPRSGEVTPTDAEALAAEWMRHLGEPTAYVTRAVGDGGIDVVGQRYIAQVKDYQSNVGITDLREFGGVVTGDPYGRRGLYFTKTGYVASAIDYATRVDIALFRYNAWEGTLTAINPPAERLRHGGLGIRR